MFADGLERTTVALYGSYDGAQGRSWSLFKRYKNPSCDVFNLSYYTHSIQSKSTILTSFDDKLVLL
jgi:hypothetical protein